MVGYVVELYLDGPVVVQLGGCLVMWSVIGWSCGSSILGWACGCAGVQLCGNVVSEWLVMWLYYTWMGMWLCGCAVGWLSGNVVILFLNGHFPLPLSLPVLYPP